MENRGKSLSRIRLMRLLSILIVMLTGLASLYAKVPQKIAVLDFTSENKERGYAFLKKSIPQSLELRLDKLERFYVIRKYLWEENYVPEKPVVTAEDMLRFCLKTGMDGVITGKIVYRENSADVILSVYDAAKAAFVLTDKKSIQLNDRIFNTVDAWLDPVSVRVTNLFPPKDESVIIKERKKIKYIYEDIKKRPHQLVISAGYEYALANLSLTKAASLSSQKTNYKYSASLNGFDIYAGYRFKSAEAGMGVAWVAGGQKNKMSDFSFRAGAWLLRDVFNPFLQLSLYHYSFPDGYFKSSVLQGGLKMKPTENFIFGMTIGSKISDGMYYKRFMIQDLIRQRDGGMFFSFFYEIHASSKLAVYLSMGMKEVRIRYETSNSQQDFEFENNVSFINAQATYKLEWGK
jgi:hypothetical protein